MDISVDARDLMTDNTFEIQKICISYKKSRYMMLGDQHLSFTSSEK